MTDMLDRLIESRFYKALILSLITLSFGTFGYLFLFDYSFIDSLYMTVITTTTVGFGEIQPFETEEKIFTIILIIISIFTLGYTISLFSEYLLTGNFFKTFKQNHVKKQINKMNNHVIVCGLGRNGSQVIETLLNHNRKIVAIDQNTDILNSYKDNKDIVTIEGDATSDEILLLAGIESASSIITALPSDADNLFVVLTSKQLNKNCNVISRASSDSSYKKIKFAGADNVIMPDKLGGSHMASLVVNPDLVEFVDNLAIVDGEKNANLREIAINDLSEKYIGKTVLDLDLRRKTGCNLIGFKNKNGEYVINPDVTTILERGTYLILLGRAKQIEKLKDLI